MVGQVAWGRVWLVACVHVQVRVQLEVRLVGVRVLCGASDLNVSFGNVLWMFVPMVWVPWMFSVSWVCLKLFAVFNILYGVPSNSFCSEINPWSIYMVTLLLNWMPHCFMLKLCLPPLITWMVEKYLMVHAILKKCNLA